MEYRQLEGNIGELKFYGNISEWWINGTDFSRTLDEMSAKFKTIHIRAHCYGGSVFEGNVIANSIRRCTSKIIVFIDGVSASMMAIVMQEADEVEAAENAFIMVHSPSGREEGTAKKFLETSKLLTSMEKNFTRIIARKTGKTEKEVAALFDEQDHWFSADEALAYGLVTRIGKPVTAEVVAIDKPAEGDDIESVFERFAAIMTSPTNQDKTPKEDSNMKKELIAKFGLTGVTENSSDAEITAAIQTKLDGVNTEKTAATDSAVEAIIAAMETATGKAYPADVRANLVTVGKTSGFSVLQSMLGITAPTAAPAAQAVQAAAAGAAGAAPIAAVPAVLTILAGGAGALSEARKDWTWYKWQEEDPDGIEDLPKSNPDLFKALYKAKYKVDVIL